MRVNDNVLQCPQARLAERSERSWNMLQDPVAWQKAGLTNQEWKHIQRRTEEYEVYNHNRRQDKGSDFNIDVSCAAEARAMLEWSSDPGRLDQASPESRAALAQLRQGASAYLQDFGHLIGKPPRMAGRGPDGLGVPDYLKAPTLDAPQEAYISSAFSGSDGFFPPFHSREPWVGPSRLEQMMMLWQQADVNLWGCESGFEDSYDPQFDGPRDPWGEDYLRGLRHNGLPHRVLPDISVSDPRRFDEERRNPPVFIPAWKTAW